jgi:DNA-binding beta-propeller fold protein YncE
MRGLLVVLVPFLVAVVWWLAAPPRGPTDALEPTLVVGGNGVSPWTLLKPRAIAVEPGGNFYVVDRRGIIHYFDARGEVVRRWETPEHEFGAPVGLAIEADGSLLVSDSHYSRILRYSRGGESELARWGSRGTGPGQLTWGRDVVVDSAGLVYVGDYGGMNDRILKFSPRGEFLLEWGRQGEAEGEFRKIQGMTIEPREGRELLLVADSANHRLQRFTLEGEFLGAIGRVGRGPGEFRYPQSVAVDSAGSIYVCEWGNNRIQKLTADGEFLGFWGGPGRGVGQLHTPWDIEIGAGDRIYVVDYGNHRVQVFRWTARAGDALSAGPADDPLTGKALTRVKGDAP